MGARFYNAATGRSTSLDLVPGGNATPYAYPNDPINMSDLDGKWGRWIRALRSGTVFDPRRTFGVGTCAFYCASLSYQGGAASFSFGGVGGYRQGIGVSAGYGAHLAGMRTHKTWDLRKRWHLVRKIYE